MRVFIGEYICGGGFASTPVTDLPAGLLAEGTCMFRAICEDASRCADVVTALDYRLPTQLPACVTAVPIDAEDNVTNQWLQAAADCDSAILIAPETDGILAKLVSAFRADKKNVIAGNASFLDLATDKLQLARCLAKANVSHPVTLATNASPVQQSTQRWILKPVDGCGSSDIERFDSYSQADNQRRRRAGNWIVQTFHPGEPISIAAIVGPNGIQWLPACRQHIDSLGFNYCGGQAPLPESLALRGLKLAEGALHAALAASSQVVDAANAVGYVGIDLVLAENPRDDVVIEINPRLTTSFVGLRHLMKTNLAATMLGLNTAPLLQDPNRTAVQWDSSGQVTFAPDAVALK